MKHTSWNSPFLLSPSLFFSLHLLPSCLLFFPSLSLFPFLPSSHSTKGLRTPNMNCNQLLIKQQAISGVLYMYFPMLLSCPHPHPTPSPVAFCSLLLLGLPHSTSLWLQSHMWVSVSESSLGFPFISSRTFWKPYFPTHACLCFLICSPGSPPPLWSPCLSVIFQSNFPHSYSDKPDE